MARWKYSCAPGHRRVHKCQPVIHQAPPVFRAFDDHVFPQRAFRRPYFIPFPAPTPYAISKHRAIACTAVASSFLRPDVLTIEKRRASAHVHSASSRQREKTCGDRFHFGKHEKKVGADAQKTTESERYTDGAPAAAYTKRQPQQ